MFRDCKVNFAYVGWTIWKMLFLPVSVCRMGWQGKRIWFRLQQVREKIMQPRIFVGIMRSNWRSSRLSLAGVDSILWIATRTSSALFWKQRHEAESTGDPCFDLAEICSHSLHSLHCNFDSFKRFSTCLKPSSVSLLSLSSSLDAVDQAVLDTILSSLGACWAWGSH